MAVSDEPSRSDQRFAETFSELATVLHRAREGLVEWAAGRSIGFGLAGAVGLGTGLLTAALIQVIGVVQQLAFGADPSQLRLLLTPAVGALVVGVIVTYWLPESRGSGEVQIMRSIAVNGGQMRARTPLGGLLVSGTALGSGISGGREGPIVFIGGSVGSLLAQFFCLDDERKRGLIGAGAAAGIGAAFNAPIGGMLYSIELILGGMRARSLQMVVIASVVSAVTARAIIGEALIYEPGQPYKLNDPRELLLYILLGLAAVVAGLAMQYSEHWMATLSRRLPGWPPLRFAAGGLVVGLIALWLPEVLGTGHSLPPVDGIDEPILAMLNNAVGDVGLSAAAFLVVLALGKLAATVFAVGNGNPVGTFAPLLFLGAALGGAFGNTATQLLPDAGIQPGAFALVGMAAVFSAAARAPLTAIVIPFEITGDYELVLPLMLAAGLATLVADRIQPESIHTMPLRHEGIIASDPEEIDLLQTVTVDAVMTTDPLTVPPDMPLSRLRTMLLDTGNHAVPVMDGDDLIGVVAPADVSPDHSEGANGHRDDAGLSAGDLCTSDPVTVAPSAPVYRAMRRMASSDIGMVPVVNPRDPHRLLGVVRRSDLVDAYRQAADRSLDVQQRRETSRLRDLGNACFLELEVDPDAPVAGHAVRDITWPGRAVLTGVHRNGELVLPDGNTVLRPADRLVVLADQANSDELRRLITQADEDTGA